MPLSAAQCRAARKILNWTQEDLAHAAGLSIYTIRKFEREADIEESTADMMRRAFEGAGITFSRRDRSEAGVRLAMR